MQSQALPAAKCLTAKQPEVPLHTPFKYTLPPTEQHILASYPSALKNGPPCNGSKKKKTSLSGHGRNSFNLEKKKYTICDSFRTWQEIAAFKVFLRKEEYSFFDFSRILISNGKTSEFECFFQSIVSFA